MRDPAITFNTTPAAIKANIRANPTALLLKISSVMITGVTQVIKQKIAIATVIMQAFLSAT